MLLDEEFEGIITDKTIHWSDYPLKSLSTLTTKELWQLESLINIELRSRDKNEDNN